MTTSINQVYVEKFKAGDMEAFEYIYQYYKNSIYYFAFSITKNKADAEEVMQNTFIKVFNSIQTLKENNSFHPWLYRIAYTIAINMYRKNVRQVELGEDDNLETKVFGTNIPNDEFDKKAIYDAVYAEISKMPDLYSQVAVMKFFDGLTFKEISVIVGIPVGTVKTRITTVRKKIKPILDRKGYHPRKYFGFVFVPFMVELFQEHSKMVVLSQGESNIAYQNILSEIPKQSAAESSVPKNNNRLNWKTIGLAGMGMLMFGCYMIFQSISADTTSNIQYSIEPTNQPVEVEMMIDESVSDKNIEVWFDDEKISFSRKNDIVSFYAEENGIYRLLVNNDDTELTIANIDTDAPIIDSVEYTDGYIHVKTKGDQSSIDYDNSFYIMGNEKYSIPEDLRIANTEEESIHMCLYDSLGNYREYRIELSAYYEENYYNDK